MGGSPPEVAKLSSNTGLAWLSWFYSQHCIAKPAGQGSIAYRQVIFFLGAHELFSQEIFKGTEYYREFEQYY